MNLLEELEKKAVSISNPARKIVLLSIVKNEISSAREELLKSLCCLECEQEVKECDNGNCCSECNHGLIEVTKINSVMGNGK